MMATAIETSHKHKTKDTHSATEKKEKKERKKRKLHHDTALIPESASPTNNKEDGMNIHYENNDFSHLQSRTDSASVTTVDADPSLSIDGSTDYYKPKSHSSTLNTSTSTARNNAVFADNALSSPYVLVTTSRYFPLSPAYSQNPKLGIKNDHLDPLIFKYEPTLDGVVLLHDNLRFASTTARIMNDSPFAFAWAFFDVMLWKPQRGMVLEGWVNNASPSHIGLLFANVFNVSVPKEGIPNNWTWVENATRGSGGGTETGTKYDAMLGSWMDEQGITVQDTTRFRVVQVKADGGMLSLEGSFMPDSSQAIHANEVNITNGVRQIEITSEDEEARRQRERKERKKEKKRRKEKEEES